MKNQLEISKSQAEDLDKIATPSNDPLQYAIQALPALDIPAKGRIAHHIRRGRIDRAIALCAAGQLHLWKHIWANARSVSVLDQLSRLKQVEDLLRAYAGYGPAASAF